MSQPILAHARAGLQTHASAEGVVVHDAASGQQHVLGALEARLWGLLDGVRSVSELARALSTPQTPVAVAQVWIALDALADRGLLAQRLAPPAAETVSTHQPMGRRQWALAGLAMAATPMAFAASAAATEEKSKDFKAAQEENVKARESSRVAEQEAKRAQQLERREEQVDARQKEEQRKRSAAAEQDEKRLARRDEHRVKSEARAAEDQEKASARRTEQQAKRDKQ